MQRDLLYLSDMIGAAEAIAKFIAATNEERFVADDLVRSAVLQKLTIIGEAAARISAELRQQYPAIPWRDVIAFRNMAVHRYFSIDWHVVWNAATIDAPKLHEELLKIVAALEARGNP